MVRPIITAAQKGYLPRTSIFFYTAAWVYTFVVRDLPIMIDKLKEVLIGVFETIIGVKEKVEQFAKDLKEFVQTVVDSVKNWWNKNFNSGYKYASANPQISVDPYKLRNYAQRLQAVNSRITRLDGRLDSLYWRVGLLDLWDLMQADMLTGYSWRLNRCTSYLTDTASDFENAETAIISNL